MINFFFLSISFLIHYSFEEPSSIELDSNYKLFENIQEKVPLNLYTDISTLDKEQEAAITINSNTFNKDLFISCSFSDTAPTSDVNFSKEKCVFNLFESGFDNYYHLFFKKKQNSNYFLISFTVANYESKPYFNISLTKVKLQRTRYSKNNYEIINIRPYYPIFRKYVIQKQVDWGLNYLFVTSSSCMNVWDGNLLKDNDKVNENVSQRKISIITLPKDKNITKVVVLRLITDNPNENQIRLIFKNIENEAEFDTTFDSKPQRMTYHIQDTNPFEDFYFIKQYTEPSIGLVYFEKVLGEFIVYYTNRIEDSSPDFLPSPNYGYKLTDFYTMTYSDIDIFSIDCKGFCFFNIHFISEHQLGNEFLLIDKTNYALVSKNNPRKMYVNEDITKYVITITTSNKKYVDIYINGHLEYKLNYTETIISFSPNQKVESIELITENEPVLVIITVNKRNEYIVYEKEDIRDVDANNKVVFSIPKHKDTIDSFDFHISGNTSTVFYHIGYGQTNQFFNPDIESPKKIEMLNPYRYTNLKNSGDNFFYVTFYSTNKFTITHKYTPVNTKLSVFKKDEPKKVLNEVNFTLEKNDKEYNKYLVIVVTKCGINEVDLYLRLNGIELKREFLERQYNLLVYEDAFIPYQVSLEKGYDYQDFNGVLFYYTYATKTEVENFKITDGFHLSYEEKEKIKSNKHQNISLNWISPFSRKSNIGNPMILYNVYINEIKNEKTDICTYDHKEGYTVESDKWDVSIFVELNRNKNYYISLTGRLKNDSFNEIRPIFLYPQIKVPMIIEGSGKLWIVFLIIAFVLLIIAAIFCYMYSKMKVNAVKLTQEGYSFTNLASGPLY